jgi:GWxTD domain-containing protein
MMYGVLAVATMVAGLGASPPGWQGGGEPLKVSVVRFYQPASATTTIEGVCEIRLAALRRPASGAREYRVEVEVSDSTGTVLQHSDLSRQVPATLDQGGDATALESFGFNAAPGRYRLRVRVVPSVGEALESSVAVTAFDRPPAMSDLLLANNVRQPSSDSEPATQGEVRRAGLMMRTAPAPRLTAVSAQLSWYAEAYTGVADSGSLVAEVLGPGGRRIVGTQPRAVTFPAGGGLTRGSLDLTGLPAGDYRLRLRLQLHDSSQVIEAPFGMNPVASAATADAGAAAAPAQARPEAADLFEAATEEQLDSLEAPLMYMARNSRDLALYHTLTAQGKRRFLREFWASGSHRIDGSVDRDNFYRAVAFVNAAFHEQGSAQLPGWNTDRGRVFLRNGRWDEVLAKPSATVPYVVWKYTRGQQRWYIFVDRTGVGNYGLLATNDSHETGSQQVGWEGFLGPDATRDAYAFLGMDLRNFGIR